MKNFFCEDEINLYYHQNAYTYSSEDDSEDLFSEPISFFEEEAALDWDIPDDLYDYPFKEVVSKLSEEDKRIVGVCAENYMKYELETYPSIRIPGESNPLFNYNDLLLVGGGKDDWIKVKNNKKKVKKTQQRAQIVRTGIGTRNIDRRLPGVRGNEFPMVRRMVQPTTQIVDFVYDITSAPFNNSGGPIVGEVWYSDDPYDWLSSILTQVMQFLNRQFQIYGKGKVITFSPSFSFSNLEQNELDLFYFSSPESQTLLASGKAAIESAAATGIYRGSQVMSEQYGKNSKIIFRDSIHPGQVIGNTIQYKASDDFAFTQSSNPGRLTYYGWYAVSPLNTIPTGFTRRAHIEARILFYDMLTLSANVSAVKPKSESWICPRSLRNTEHRIIAIKE